jgi:hypothetical protein
MVMDYQITAQGLSDVQTNLDAWALCNFRVRLTGGVSG